MNRKERRKANSENEKLLRKMWSKNQMFCDIPPELQGTLKDGEKFTMEGLGLKEDGGYGWGCLPGKEVEFIARHSCKN